jgi:hypothetical protein
MKSRYSYNKSTYNLIDYLVGPVLKIQCLKKDNTVSNFKVIIQRMLLKNNSNSYLIVCK